MNESILITTSNALEGYRVTKQLGLVRGITVRSRSLFGNMAELIGVGAVPKDLETSASTGYIFHITRSADGKTWWASAEPALYGRSGKLSFYLDAAGVRSGDVGGKPLVIKN